MELVLIRHGQTVNNHEGKHQGWQPVALSEKGISQAKRIQERLKEESFDHIVVSDLQRTRETAEIVFQDRIDQIAYSSAIREINTDAIFGKTYDQMTKQYGEVYIQGRKNLDYGFCGGESGEHFRERVAQFLKQYEDANSKQRIAVVTHGGVLSVMLSYFLNAEVSLAVERFVIDNCGISCVQFHQDGWKIKSWNDYLKDIMN